MYFSPFRESTNVLLLSRISLKVKELSPSVNSLFEGSFDIVYKCVEYLFESNVSLIVAFFSPQDDIITILINIVALLISMRNQPLSSY